jgi:hypothetical protein
MIAIPLLLIVVGMFSIQVVNAQDKGVFEGKAVYEMSGEEHPGTATLTYYIRPDAMRLEMSGQGNSGEMKNGMGKGMGPQGAGTMIFKGDKVYMLMPEQKMYTEMSMKMSGMDEWYKEGKEKAEEMGEMEKDKERFEMAATNETRQILGYNAKKYVFKDEEDDYRTEIWFTEELGAFVPLQSAGQEKRDEYMWQSNIKGTNLFPLEILVYDNNNKLSTKMTATEVKAMKVDEDMVTIPEGYSKMGLGSLFNGNQ